ERGKERWEATFLLTPLQPGKHPLHLPSLHYRSGSTRTKVERPGPIWIEVITRVKKAEPGAARDITSIEELPALEPSGSWLPWALGGAALLALGGALAFLLRRGPGRGPVLTPEQRALAALDRLAEERPTAEEMERFHRRLSAVLRRYLEERCGLPAERRTTAEFLTALQQAPAPLPAE